MVARKEKLSSGRERYRSESPNLNIEVELDNKALKAKNNNLTQTVAKLQQENAELIKQFTLLQGENFEINSKYNNIKNVISIIDSKTKMCLPKINDIVETFSGIIQLCSVANSISNYVMSSSAHKDTKTQAVKPHIVNGHILHNPTITLSRLSNGIPNTPPRPSQQSNDIVQPSTSREAEASDHSTTHEDSDSELEDNQNGNEDHHTSIVRRTSSSRTHQLDSNVNTSLYAREHDSSDEENEEPSIDEEMEADDADEGQAQERLTTIHEVEEEEEMPQSSSFRQQRFLQGRLQEVRIYLNQLPNTYINQSCGTSNISISVSPPERRSSFTYRTSSLVGEANDTVMDSGRFYLEEHTNCSRISQGDASMIDNSRRSDTKAKLSLSFQNNPVTVRSSQCFEANSDRSQNSPEHYAESVPTVTQSSSTSASTVIHNESNSMQDTFRGLDLLHIELQHQTSTPIVSRLSDGTRYNNNLQLYDSPNRSKSDSIIFARNITKRRGIREKNKVPQVILDRLSIESRLSTSPIKAIEDVVNMPPIRTFSQFKARKGKSSASKTSEGKPRSTKSCSGEENVEKKGKGKRNTKSKKKGTPGRKVGNLTPKTSTSPEKTSLGRPTRAAKPGTLKEPSLVKKLRRSK